MNTIIHKLTSRKLWTSIASFVAMLMVYNGATENEAAQITALIMAGATVIAYTFSEGFADAMGAQHAAPETETEADYSEDYEEDTEGYDETYEEAME